MTVLWGPVPPDTNRTTQPFWDATRDRRLVIQRCIECGRFQHYPRPVCNSCLSSELEFTGVSGVGRVASWTTVHRSPDADHFEVPYTVGLVDLEEGPRLLTRIEGEPEIDGRVEVGWFALSDGRHLPIFEMKED